MRKIKFKGKIILPTVIIAGLLVFIMSIYTVINFTGFANYLLHSRVMATATSLKFNLEEIREATLTAALIAADNIDVIKAIKERNTNEIIRLLAPAYNSYLVNFYTITDNEGIILARTHEPSNFGDSIAYQQNIKDSLAGKAGTYVEPGTAVRVSVRSGAPVYDTDGTIIGVIIAGMRLDTYDFVDRLKERYRAEFSIFMGNTRIATTIMHDGERITGTTLDPDIAKIVIEEGRESHGYANILGESYTTFYLPLFSPQGEVFAIIFTGISNKEVFRMTSSLIFGGILIGLLGLAASILGMTLIGTKIIKPVNSLVKLVSEVSRGNVDISTKENVTNDEIGVLTQDVYFLINIIKTILGDMSKLAHDFKVHGNITHRIDTSKYKGSFQSMTEGINELVDAVSEMNKAMAIMDYLDTMICISDLNYNLLYVNRSMAVAYRIDREKCLGQKCYKAIRNYDKPCPFCLMQNFLPIVSSYPSEQHSYIWDEFLGLWLGGRSAIIRWVDGSFALFHAFNDVTLQKSHEEQLRNAKQTAEDASNAKSSFLANMSHELRTPLNVIIGMSDLWMEDKNLPPKIVDEVKKINNAGEILLGIINDILDISKIEAGKLDFILAEYSTASLLNDIITLHMIRFQSKQIQFNLDINEDLPAVLIGDALRVKQIFNNLLSNAYKYTQAGSVLLKVFCTYNTDQSVILSISVKDTGSGIRPEDTKRLFSEYNQIDTEANRKFSGTGLGLSITKMLAEMMNGEIGVESEFGIGSTFHVKIQQGYVNDQKVGAELVENLKNFSYRDKKQHASSKIVRPDLSYVKVLVVDDFIQNLEIAAALLGKYKMQVDCVLSGQEAIDRIKNEEPVYNAIFMDHMMPGLDGMETTQIIRGIDSEYAKNIPIIALTANAITGNEQWFLENGFQAFLAKPMNIMLLDSIIKQWICKPANS
jgi:signal transduction histidine kinase/HAMP domain-containing protein